MRVIIVGASSNRAKFGNKAVRAYLRRRHDVYPVNPYEREIEGVRAYPDVREVPGPVDRVTMYVPPHVGDTILDALAERADVSEVYFNPGSATPALLEKACALGLRPVQGCSIVDIGEQPD